MEAKLPMKSETRNPKLKTRMILTILFPLLWWGEVRAADLIQTPLENLSGEIITTKLDDPQAGAPNSKLETLSDTPSVNTTTQPALLITEVSFKNPKGCKTCGWGDWIEIYCAGEAGTKLDLSGYRIEVGWESVKTIAPGTKIKAGEYLVLNRGFFLDKKKADNGGLSLFNPDMELLETDSQVILYDRKGRICDAVCWADQDATWTAANIERVSSMIEAGQWIMSLDKPDQSDCFSSQLLKPGESLVRKKGIDTQTKDDWEIDSTPTMGRNNESLPLPVKIKDPKVSEGTFYIDGSDPKRAVTEIVFYLNIPAKTDLQVYDREGNIRKTLLKDQYLFSGKNSIVWDGTNDRGKPVAMGDYICHLKVKDPISITEDEVALNVVAAVKIKR
ncbi:MAG: hypothetical protein AB1797_09540 [bacterium]